MLYLRNARYCYLRWGADGKVRQLDEIYPHLRMEEPAPASTSTIAAPVEHLDLATVIKVSQAVSGEIVLEKLIDTLMRTAIEQAGAERGLLIVPRGAEQRIEAEATTDGDLVTVHLRDEAVAATCCRSRCSTMSCAPRKALFSTMPQPTIHFPPIPTSFSVSARSILCLPLINQGKLIGILYLENNLTPNVFTPAASRC